jgi:hypothetical protein
METKVSLPCLQELDIVPYPEPLVSTSNHLYLDTRFNIIFEVVNTV